jgi:hypothetical protein
VRLIPDIGKTKTLRRGVEVTLRLARESHDLCEGCECQHRVPSIDQLERKSIAVH